MARVRKEGALSIRDIDDDELVEKDHPWASRKPSKRALQMAFFAGLLTVSERDGMVKTYELVDRHFGWPPRPRAASRGAVLDYLLDRALRSQGIVSLDFGLPPRRARKPAIAEADRGPGAAARKLVPVAVEGAGRQMHWMPPGARPRAPAAEPVHLLSPFDPLVIQRKRLTLFFGYDHRFEAYVPKEKRRARLLRAAGAGRGPHRRGHRSQDRPRGGESSDPEMDLGGRRQRRRAQAPIEEALHRFERFQLETPANPGEGGSADGRT